MQTKENIYEELKSSLIRKNQQVSSLSAVTPTLDNKQKDVKDLNAIFDNIISKREAMFSKFNDLYGWKTNVLETMLSTFIGGYYSSEIDKNVNDIIIAFDLFYIINSPEFVSVFNSFMLEFGNVSSGGLFNTSASASLAIKQNFFRAELESYAAEILPDIAVSALADQVLDYQNNIEGFYLGNTLGITNSKLSEKQYKLILLLAMLSANKTDGQLVPAVKNSINYTSEIAQLKTEIDQTGIYNTDEELFNLINKVKDLLKSFLLVETYREENDAAYYADGTQSLNDYFSDFNEQLSSITDIASLYREGAINFSLREFIIDTNEKIKTTVVNIFDQAAESIQVLDSFAENYEPFLEKQTLLNDTILNSLKIIDEIDEEFDEETALTTTITSVEDLFDQKKKDFEFATGFKHIFGGSSSYMRSSEWVQRINLVTKGVNISDSIMLYTTLQMRNINGFMDQVEVFNKALNYSVTSLIQEGVAYTESVKEDFLSIIEKERNIFNTFGVKISNNINNEKIPSTLKSLLKGLEIIDLISFDDYLENLSISLDTTKTQAQIDAALAYLNDFQKKISFIILEEFAKAKEDINIIIPKIVDSFKTAKSNFKTIILEIEIKKAFENIFGYIDSKLSFDQTTGRLLSNETVLANETILLLKDFLISTKSSIDALENIAKDYKDVWNFFYNNNKLDEDIVNIALKDENAWDEGEQYNTNPTLQNNWFDSTLKKILKFDEPKWILIENIRAVKPVNPVIDETTYFDKIEGKKQIATIDRTPTKISNVRTDIIALPDYPFPSGTRYATGINEGIYDIIEKYFFIINSEVIVQAKEQVNTGLGLSLYYSSIKDTVNIFFDTATEKLYRNINNIFTEETDLNILSSDPSPMPTVPLGSIYKWYNTSTRTLNIITPELIWKDINFTVEDITNDTYIKFDLSTGKKHALAENKNPIKSFVWPSVITGTSGNTLPFSSSALIDGGIFGFGGFREAFNKLKNTYFFFTPTQKLFLITEESANNFFLGGYRVKYTEINSPQYFYDTTNNLLYTSENGVWPSPFIGESVPSVKPVRNSGDLSDLKWYDINSKTLYIESVNIDWNYTSDVGLFATERVQPELVGNEYIDANGNLYRYNAEVIEVEKINYFSFLDNLQDRFFTFVNNTGQTITESAEIIASKFNIGDRWYETIDAQTVKIHQFRQTLKNLLRRK